MLRPFTAAYTALNFHPKTFPSLCLRSRPALLSTQFPKPLMVLLSLNYIFLNKGSHNCWFKIHSVHNFQAGDLLKISHSKCMGLRKCKRYLNGLLLVFSGILPEASEKSLAEFNGAYFQIKCI